MKSDNPLAILMLIICFGLAVSMPASAQLTVEDRLWVPFVAQYDLAWAEQVMTDEAPGSWPAGDTYGDCGCFLTALSMVLQYHAGGNVDLYWSPYAHETVGATPPGLNHYFYSNGGILSDPDETDCGRVMVEFNKLYRWQTISVLGISLRWGIIVKTFEGELRTEIHEWLDADYPVIARTRALADSDGDGINDTEMLHYVVIAGWNPETQRYLIHNPLADYQAVLERQTGGWGITPLGDPITQPVFEYEPEKIEATLLIIPRMATTDYKEFNINFKSPGELYVTDPDGLVIGVDPLTGSFVNETDGFYFSYGWDKPTEPGTVDSLKIVQFPTLKEGPYQIQVIGTGNGPFKIMFNVGEQEITGEITEGQVLDFEVNFPPPPWVSTAPSTGIAQISATLHGTINPNLGVTSAWFEWGTDPTLSVNEQTPISTFDAIDREISVSNELNNLESDTLYFFRLVASNSGGTEKGEILSFLTFPVPPPEVITLPASQIIPEGAEVSGTVNPNGFETTAWFEWGTDLTLSTYETTSELSVGSGNVAQTVSTSLGGLIPDGTYYYRIAASNEGGITKGSVETFTTPSPSLASVITLPADPVLTWGATLIGSINPKGATTEAWFEWGNDPSLNVFVQTPIQNIGSGITAELISEEISGLTTENTYYYRVVASNAAGIEKGEILSFTTPVPSITLSIDPRTNYDPDPVFVTEGRNLRAEWNLGPGIFNCSWDLGDGTVDSPPWGYSQYCTNYHEYMAAGTYKVNVIIRDRATGNEYIQSMDITVQSEPELCRGKLKWKHHLVHPSDQTFHAKAKNTSTLDLIIRIDTTVDVPRYWDPDIVKPSFTLSNGELRTDLTYSYTPTPSEGRHCLSAVLTYGLDINGDSILQDSEVSGTSNEKNGCFRYVR